MKIPKISICMLLAISSFTLISSCGSKPDTKPTQNDDNNISSPENNNPPLPASISVSQPQIEHEKQIEVKMKDIMNNFDKFGFDSAIKLYNKETLNLSNLNKDTWHKWNGFEIFLYFEGYLEQLKNNNVLLAIKRLSDWAALEHRQEFDKMLSLEFARTSEWSISTIKTLIDIGSFAEAENIIIAIESLLEKNDNVVVDNAARNKAQIISELKEQSQKIVQLASTNVEQVKEKITEVGNMFTSIKELLKKPSEEVLVSNVDLKVKNVLNILKLIIKHREIIFENWRVVGIYKYDIVEDLMNYAKDKFPDCFDPSDMSVPPKELNKLMFMTEIAQINSLLTFINKSVSDTYKPNFDPCKMVKDRFIELENLYNQILNKISENSSDTSIVKEQIKNLNIIYNLMKDLNTYFFELYKETDEIDINTIFSDMFSKSKSIIKEAIKTEPMNLEILDVLFPESLEKDGFIGMIRTIQDDIRDPSHTKEVLSTTLASQIFDAYIKIDASTTLNILPKI